MIPKVIHYCWVGGNPLPELAQKCINSWRKYCPDYEIKEWNESNYDFSKNKYMADAYKEKKWGFVPDYARFDIIYTFGGIYLDTDVEIIKPLDDLLDNKAILGFESKENVAAGLIIAGEKGIPLFKEMYEQYESLSFYNPDGTLNLTPSPFYSTQVLLQHGLKQNNELQKIDDVTIYPTEYFCPKSIKTRLIQTTENSYTIHHYDGSWVTGATRKLINEKNWIAEHFKNPIIVYLLQRIMVLKKIIVSLFVREK